MKNLIKEFLSSEKSASKKNVKRFSDKQLKEEAFDEKHVGIQAVPLAKITGSVGRYQDFDHQFRLKRNRPSNRLKSIRHAINQGKMLPPVHLYQIKDEFYVLDGNHRVSAAKQLGHEFIDAHIIEFLPSKNTLENLVYREKNGFLSKTRLPDVIDLTELGQYGYLLEQISEHQQYLASGTSGTLTLEAAADDWYQTIYRPLSGIIRNSRLPGHFPKRTVADLYAYITFHQWKRGRSRKYGIGIDQLIPKNMGEFRLKMSTIKEFELPEMSHWMSAFILISVIVGREYPVMDKLYRMDEIQEVHFVHGDFDLLAKIIIKRELLASDAEVFGRLIHEKVRRIPGVTKTQTLIPISSKQKPCPTS
jgi:DNA-binding Lrp family transcriptional regulator